MDGMLAQETVIHPKPVPEVVTFLKQILEGNPDDELLKSGTYETLDD